MLRVPYCMLRVPYVPYVPYVEAALGTGKCLIRLLAFVVLALSSRFRINLLRHFPLGR